MQPKKLNISDATAEAQNQMIFPRERVLYGAAMLDGQHAMISNMLPHTKLCYKFGNIAMVTQLIFPWV